jgi:hypothetical protein
LTQVIENKDAVKFSDEFTFNVIPVKEDDKSIDDYEYKRYHNELYYKPIAEGQNIGVILGKTSNYLICFDCDAPELYDYLKHYEGRTFIVKSGRKGYHVYFRLTEEDKDYTGAKIKKDGKTIELFLKNRFIVLPPSFIKGDSIRPYEIISNVKPKLISRTEYEGILKSLKDKGFTITPTKETKDNGEKIRSDKTTDEILNEDWSTGDRYDNGYRLALRRFHFGWEYEQVKEEAIKKNSTLSNPHDYDHVIEWVNAGYKIYQSNIKSGNNYFKPTKEFLKDVEIEKRTNIQSDKFLDKACELLREYDKSIAEVKFSEWNATEEDKKTDTQLKGIIAAAVRKIKKEQNKIYEPDEISQSIKVYELGIRMIEDKSRSANNTSQVVIKVRINQKPHWIDIQSTVFEQLLRIETKIRYDEIFSDSVFQNAIKTLHAEILHSGIPARPVFNRCAFVDGIIYYNLQDNDGTIIRITKDTIEEVEKDESMPIFIKTNRTEASIQPRPNYSNTEALNDFVTLCRIQGDDQIIFKSHVIAQFLNNIPIPIDIYHGEQGSAKTSVSSAVKSIVDPEGENAMSLPDKIDDIVIMMMSREKIVFDNCENFTKDISQFLCKSVTGTTYGKRELFTTSDEFSVMLKEKISLNGIAPNINQPDLLERSIFYELKRIDKRERITDDDFKTESEKLKPCVLGCVFSTLQKAMIIYDDVKKELTGKSLPRMASFAVWGESISRSLGNEDKKFIDRYNEKLDVSSLSLQEDYPMIQPLVKYIEGISEEELKRGHEETLKILFDKVIVALGPARDERLPANTKSFGKELKQLAPMIRNLDYEVTTKVFNERNSKVYARGTNLVTIRKLPSSNKETV